MNVHESLCNHVCPFMTQSRAALLTEPCSVPRLCRTVTVSRTWRPSVLCELASCAVQAPWRRARALSARLEPIRPDQVLYGIFVDLDLLFVMHSYQVFLSISTSSATNQYLAKTLSNQIKYHQINNDNSNHMNVDESLYNHYPSLSPLHQKFQYRNEVITRNKN
jgi:hypothetical protein